MNRSVFWLLVRKDLYLLRVLSIAGVVIGLLALFLMFFGKVAYAVGGVLYLTANIASALMLAMASLLGERKEQTRLFALSLPVSGQQYDLAKLVATQLTYLIPWLIMTAVALCMAMLWPAIPKGYLVFTILLQGSFLTLFCVFVATLFVLTSEFAGGLAILVVNVMFTLFMIMLSQPANSGPLNTPHIIWTPFAKTTLAVEVLMTLTSIAFALIAISRKRDHL
jgi:ABC-2 type transport system permease protein